MSIASDQLDYITNVMKGFDRPWFIAGGWAIDLGIGRVTRPHDDIDITIYREDIEKVFDFFHEWSIQVAIPGEHRLEPCRSVHDVSLPRYGLHLHKDDEFIEILLTDKGENNVLFRKDLSITIPVEHFENHDAEGRPYIAPEWQLLYKAKEGREKDLRDLSAYLPYMDRQRKEWLRTSIQQYLPNSPWTEMIKA